MYLEMVPEASTQCLSSLGISKCIPITCEYYKRKLKKPQPNKQTKH